MDSCRVLYRIKELMELYPQQIIALTGNHEVMFLRFLEAEYAGMWNIEWLAGDKNFSVSNTFISEMTKDKIKNLYLNAYSTQLLYEITALIKEDIKLRHKDLID